MDEEDRARCLVDFLPPCTGAANKMFLDIGFPDPERRHFFRKLFLFFQRDHFLVNFRKG